MPPTRQLIDDLAFARQKAISTRSTVYVVFVPLDTRFFVPVPSKDSVQVLNQFTNMLSGVCSSYAVLATKTIGDQPGRPNMRYLTEWKTLPEGIIIATNKFAYWINNNSGINPLNTNAWGLNRDEKTRPFAYSIDQIPIPVIEGFRESMVSMPYIGFDAQGKLFRKSYSSYYPDEVIPLTRASVFHQRNASGQLLSLAPDIREIPPGNSTNNYRRIRINWMTGRAKVEKPEITN